MGCNSPGATHHLGCDCHENDWAARLESERAARERAERERDLSDASFIEIREKAAEARNALAAERAAHAETKRLMEACHLRIAELEVAAHPVFSRRQLESRLAAAEECLREIDRRTGHFGEAPEPPEWMPMLSLIAWVGRTARAFLAGGKP